MMFFRLFLTRHCQNRKTWHTEVAETLQIRLHETNRKDNLC